MENENKWEYDYSKLYQNGEPGQPAAGAQQAGQAAGAAAPAQPAAPAHPAQQPAGEDSYANVGSSGNNAANSFDGAAAGGVHFQGNSAPGAVPPYGAPRQPACGAQANPGQNYYAGYNYGGGAVPPYRANTGAGAAPGGWQPPQANPAQKPPRKGGHSTAARVASLALALAVGFGGGMAGGYLAGSGSGAKVVVQSVTRDTTAASATTTSTDGNNLSVSEVSALVSPSVVVITTEEMVTTSGWYGQSQVVSGAGSGVVMSEDGYIMTCAHVVSGASNITVTIDSKDYTATVVGEDDESDIAVLKIDATGLTPAVMGDSDALAVGESVVAVGNPLGELGGTVTEGIVSALNRNVVIEDQEMNLIQMSASVSPGNSGGGLFNMAGELIGIVNAKSSDSEAEGLGFAIPINTAYSVAKQLLENGYVSGRPAMGVTVLDITDASTAAQYGVNTYGVYVYSVQDNSPAAAAGLQSGDRIISINDQEVTSKTDLTSYIAKCQVGDTVTLTIARGGKTLTVQVTLAEKDSTKTDATTQNSVNGGLQNNQLPDNQSGATQSSGQ